MDERRGDARAAGERWAVVLAGGEGRRILPYTTEADGTPVPKQFWRFHDERTLLSTAIERAMRFTAADHVLAVVMEEHRRWWERELAPLPRGNVLSQPLSRGTAIAILQALVEVHCRDHDPLVVVMPSDFEVDDEGGLDAGLVTAARSARAHPTEVILLGVEPTRADAEFGLVVPESGRAGLSRRVRAFVEKPHLAEAEHLVRNGALWNSFIFACRGWALYELIEDALPGVADAYLHGLARPGRETATRAQAVAELPDHDFARDVLQWRAERLRMVEMPQCGWADLGTPARLANWLEEHPGASITRADSLVAHDELGAWRDLSDHGPAGRWRGGP